MASPILRGSFLWRSNRRCRCILFPGSFGRFCQLDGATDQSAAIGSLLPDHRPMFRPAIETSTAKAGYTVRQHDAVAPAGAADRQPSAAVAGTGVCAACGVTHWMSRFRQRSARCASSTRIWNFIPPPARSADQPAARLAAGSIDQPQGAQARHVEPYASQILAASSLLCGDFNLDASDPQHALIYQSARPGLNYRDAWNSCNPDQPRAPTCGVYDHTQWTDGPDCRDSSLRQRI